MNRLDRLIDTARERLSYAIRGNANPLVAFSGGKDAIVAGHLAKSVGVKHFVCEESFYFKPQIESIRGIATHLGFDVTYTDSLDMGWLSKNRRVVFSTDTKVRSWSFAVRQQATVKRHAKRIQSQCHIFGRRTQENTVRAEVYVAKPGTQCHPLRNWRTEDVWEYFDKYSIPVPYIYGTRFGKTEGNAPFYTLHPANAGLGIQECWALVRSMDQRYHEGMFHSSERDFVK